MGFTELSHAFIAAKYYVYLKEIFGDRGEAAFCMLPDITANSVDVGWHSGRSGTENL